MLHQIRQTKKESMGLAQAGFTIIEVMIVLAVAGLIMAIVFLAVPALQRNNRNTQRTADASRVLAAVGECLAANNGQRDSCDVIGEVDDYFTASSNQQLVAVAIGAAAPTVPADVNTLNIGYSAKCNAAGSGLDASGTTSTRQYAALYLAETNAGGNTTRCIAS